MTSALISPEELHGILTQKNVRILDASYNLPSSASALSGAVDFDIDDIADSNAPLAHTIPTPEVFSEKVGALGVGNGDLVIVYDRAGIYMAAARAWWMFRLFGHDNVRILDGGLPAWISAGYPIGQKDAAPTPKNFTAHFRPALFKDMGEIERNIARQDFTVLDARDAQRYAGRVPEPRPGLEAGHIPQSLSVPFMTLLDPATGRMKSPDTLKVLLKDAVIAQKPLACSCGSGVTACVVALALHEIGVTDAAIYGGSWAEWGADRTLPKEVSYGS